MHAGHVRLCMALHSIAWHGTTAWQTLGGAWQLPHTCRVRLRDRPFNELAVHAGASMWYDVKRSEAEAARTHASGKVQS